MPSLPSTGVFTNTYHSAEDLPKALWDALHSNPRNANVILPQTIKAQAEERSPANKSRHLSVWITCSSAFGIEFVLAVTEGYMGSYPVFIFTTLPFRALTDDYIRPCIYKLVRALDKAVPHRRVYSVFAPEPITRLFAEEWTRLTGIANYANQPFYAAKITYCTAKNLDKRNATIDVTLGYNLRPAVPDDIPAIGELCFLFAVDSFPFCLTRARADEEAALLVEKKQVWVHEAQNPGQPKEIASIVAFTRNSENVAAITKVYTNPKWRRRGCAERLVRRVCKHFLTGPGRKESVVLYVAHDNRAATNVYHRVGFAGLAKDSPPVEGVDRWLEIGFDFAKVDLGQW
ncbi:putative FR47-like protein [Lyophyllum shimeji]|uniref:FR47-like protein n=1 Tax=Lyophyllum shimeji TaxID=47721 RepID=A0A9P3UK93_LYOSH|nr:putative FR47-like protein [Lyophyllum shimeji]